MSHIANDNRPYATVEVMGRKLTGLLDSGAQSSVAGKEFGDLTRAIGFKPTDGKAAIKTADGSDHAVNEIFEVLLIKRF